MSGGEAQPGSSAAEAQAAATARASFSEDMMFSFACGVSPDFGGGHTRSALCPKLQRRQSAAKYIANARKILLNVNGGLFAHKKARASHLTRSRLAEVSNYLLKLALTERLAFTVTMQVGVVPVQAPDQLANVLPAGGVAVNVTAVPAA